MWYPFSIIALVVELIAIAVLEVVKEVVKVVISHDHRLHAQLLRDSCESLLLVWTDRGDADDRFEAFALLDLLGYPENDVMSLSIAFVGFSERNGGDDIPLLILQGIEDYVEFGFVRAVEGVELVWKKTGLGAELATYGLEIEQRAPGFAAWRGAKAD